MFEDYLRRVYPNMDLSAVTEKKQAKGKKKSEQKKDGFVPLGAEEKSNICSHQLDAMLQKIGEVEKKGQDEISEVRRAHSYSTILLTAQCFLAPMSLPAGVWLAQTASRGS